MRKLFFLILPLTFLSAQSHALNGECKPTMTVEQAKAQYDAGLSALTAQLKASYASAAQQHQAGLGEALARHEKRMADFEVHYQSEIQRIKADLNPGWREALDNATNQHNQDMANSSAQYASDARVLAQAYDLAVANARAHYRSGTEVLADQYNRAVCAK